jgi:hypothetical protein
MKLIGGGGGWFARECLLSALALGSTFVRVVIHFFILSFMVLHRSALRALSKPLIYSA